VPLSHDPKKAPYGLPVICPELEASAMTGEDATPPAPSSSSHNSQVARVAGQQFRRMKLPTQILVCRLISKHVFAST